MTKKITTQIISDPAVSSARLFAELGQKIAAYGRTHRDLFDTDDFREWQKRYRQRKGVGSCHAGSLPAESS